MRIISQDGTVNVEYEDVGIKIEGPRIYCMTYVEKLYLGIYPIDSFNKTKEVLEMIKQSAVDGKAVFQMPSE